MLQDWKEVAVENKLELKYLKPYLGHGLKVLDNYDNTVKELVGLISGVEDEAILSHNGELCNRYLSEIKPIFRRADFVDKKDFTSKTNIYMSISDRLAFQAYGADSGRLIAHEMDVLASWHVDLCNAIGLGLAVELTEPGRTGGTFITGRI